MNTIGTAFSILILCVFGSLWYLAYLSFGRAQCTGINAFALSTLSALLVILVFAIFSGFDWVNDWIASRSTTKNQVLLNRSLTEQARTVAAQVGATRRLAQPQVQEGGLKIDPSLFGDLQEG